MNEAVGFIGFGEAASAIANGWKDGHISIAPVHSFDVIASQSTSASIEELASKTTTVFSTVTAQSAESVAQELAKTPGRVRQFFDLNSVSP